MSHPRIACSAPLMTVVLLCLAGSQDFVSPAQFWDLYFRGLFVTVEHNAGSWRGQARSEPSVSGPAAILKKTSFFAFSISDRALRSYDYSHDARFTLVDAVPASVDAAFEAVIDGTYPYRDPAPFGKKRMMELFTMIRCRYHLPDRGLTMEDLERTLSATTTSPEMIQSTAALLWFLGEQRQRSSSTVVIDVLRNPAYLEPTGAHFPFFVVDAAFSALWKIDDKSKLIILLALMQRSNDAGRRKFAALFERLLSTQELLSPERCGSVWSSPEFWAKIIEPRRNYALADWDRYDAGSLFWEIRYLAATRLNRDAPALRRLTGDEVECVRQQARLRWHP
jgi:hypothetical protein